jgi:hypothetical protein
MKKLMITTAMSCMAMLVMTSSIYASTLTMSDLNSSASVITEGSAAGMRSWIVDDSEILYQQWFYYRIGNGPVYGVQNLGLTNENVGDANFEPGNDYVNVLYGAGDGLQIQVSYNLTGGSVGSMTSDIRESISIMNKSGGTISDFHFYQYSDFDLNDGGFTDAISMPNANTVLQRGADGIYLNETVVTPMATKYQIGAQSVVAASLSAGELNNSDTAYVGDSAWAFQWDFGDLVSGATRLISKDKRTAPAPEPSSMALLLIGMFGLSAYRKSRHA